MRNITQHKLVGKAGAGPISSKRHGAWGQRPRGRGNPLSLSSPGIRPTASGGSRPEPAERELVGCADLLVEHLTCDSRECGPCLFAVIPGTKSHGSSSFPKRWDTEPRHAWSSIRWRDSPSSRSSWPMCERRMPVDGLYGYPAEQHGGGRGVAGTNGRRAWLSVDAPTGRPALRTARHDQYDDGARCTPSKLATPSPALSARLAGTDDRTRHPARWSCRAMPSASRARKASTSTWPSSRTSAHDHLDYHHDFDGSGSSRRSHL